MGAGDKSQHGEDGHDGRRAIAEEGQRQTDNGHNTDTHADVDHHLEDQCGSRAIAHQTADVVLRLNAHVDAAGDDAS